MDSLHGLRTFVSIVEAGSLTAASDRLGISKKLVSKYLAELERRLGVRLLHRTTRTLSLTSAGQRYYPRSVALLEEFDAMTADVRDAETGLSGVLRVSAPVTFGELYVQGSLASFQAAHPDLTIDLRLNDRYVDLAGEGFDLAIRIGTLEASSLVARRLGTTDLVAVASPAYVARFGAPCTPEDLTQHRCIRDSNYRAGGAWPFDVNGKIRRQAVNGPFLVNSATAVRALALRGEGIALCPDYAVGPDIAAGRLVHLLRPYPSGTLSIHAVFAEARHMPARTRAAIDHLRGAFRSAPWQGEGA